MRPQVRCPTPRHATAGSTPRPAQPCARRRADPAAWRETSYNGTHHRLDRKGDRHGLRRFQDQHPPRIRLHALRRARRRHRRYRAGERDDRLLHGSRRQLLRHRLGLPQLREDPAQGAGRAPSARFVPDRVQVRGVEQLHLQGGPGGAAAGDARHAGHRLSGRVPHAQPGRHAHRIVREVRRLGVREEREGARARQAHRLLGALHARRAGSPRTPKPRSSSCRPTTATGTAPTSASASAWSWRTRTASPSSPWSR